MLLTITMMPNSSGASNRANAILVIRRNNWPKPNAPIVHTAPLMRNRFEYCIWVKTHGIRDYGTRNPLQWHEAATAGVFAERATMPRTAIGMGGVHTA